MVDWSKRKYLVRLPFWRYEVATVEAYQTASGKRYRVRYRDPDKKQTDKRGFTTKREAAQFAASVEVSISRGEYVTPMAGKITVGELAKDWLQNKRASLKPSSFHSLEVAWRVHVEPRWASTSVQAIRPSAVERWLREMREGAAISNRTKSKSQPLSATVVLRALGVLSGILDVAVKDGRVSKNSARGVTNLPKKGSHKKRRYLTHEEVVAFADATETGTQQALVLVLAYCGLRWGEAVGLRVEDANMLRRRFAVSRAAVEVDGVIIVGTPKTHERRSVPFPAFLSLPLARLCENKAPDDILFDHLGQFMRRPKTSAGTSSWFLHALLDAGIERLTPHDLRHTAASLAIASGANVKAVQKMLGHKSAAMTLDVYADLFEDDLDAVADRMQEGAISANVGRLWADGFATA
jgi:integrase